ncbi:MAG: heme-copper oxidase subunit III [Anaerolineales bacterium]|jgi:cytochrome c oxidase subunit 3/cytochrome o ubiquinol oxidase subunit 3
MESNAVIHEDEFLAGKKLGLDHNKLGMWLFLSSEIMFFGGLISAFLHFKINTPSPAEAALLDVALIGVNTFILLSSSFTVVLGLAAIQKGNSGGLVRYLGLTVLLGSLFLAGQGYEFTTLYGEGMTLQSSVYGSGFFTLTGFHGLHVLIGIVWALVVMVNGMRGKYAENKYDGVEIFGLYWHFVDIVWIVLFTIIYLI